LMSPYADLTLSGETILENQATDLTLTPEGLRLRVPDYVGRADASDPRRSARSSAISAGYHRS
jgi:epsilon-lactone hydrolase